MLKTALHNEKAEKAQELEKGRWVTKEKEFHSVKWARLFTHLGRYAVILLLSSSLFLSASSWRKYNSRHAYSVLAHIIDNIIDA